MVTQYGMTERLGAIRFGQQNGEVFLGRDMGHIRDYSEEVAAIVDEEVKKLIELLEESGIAEIEITEGEEGVRISRFPKGGTFLDGALSYLPQEAWPELVQFALDTLA